MSNTSGLLKEKIVQSCPTKVFKYDPEKLESTIEIENLGAACMLCDECTKCSKLEGFEGLIKVGVEED